MTRTNMLYFTKQEIGQRGHSFCLLRSCRGVCRNETIAHLRRFLARVSGVLIRGIPKPLFWGYLMGKKHRKQKTKKHSLGNGFIYPAISKLITLLKYFNMVEGFKLLARKLAGENQMLAINYSRIAVDLFILLKWLFVLVLWIFKISNPFLVFLVWYLLSSNLFTYFYYHIWSNDILLDKHFEMHRLKRRFTTLMLAISYTVFGFAYLYAVPFSDEFIWKSGEPTFLSSLWFSISNSLTGSYEQVLPNTALGSSIAMIQLVMMFVFLTIIIGGAIPQFGQSMEKDN